VQTEQQHLLDVHVHQQTPFSGAFAYLASLWTSLITAISRTSSSFLGVCHIDSTVKNE
jgi:hypothetical protein